MPLKAGGATRVINCQVGDDLAGQLHRRICDSIRDDLEANALYVTDERQALLIVSCDLVFIERPFMQAIAADIAAATGVPAECVLIACTHTHDGPNTFAMLHDSPRNDAYLERLRGWLAEVAKGAVASARPARVGWAKGHAHIGYNRRLCWADGTHSMYGDATRGDF